MPILVLFAWRGQPDSLVAAYHREMADAPSVTVDQPQRTLHVFASREDGAVVMDLWENEGGFRRMMDDPEFGGTSRRRTGRAIQRLISTK